MHVNSITTFTVLLTTVALACSANSSTIDYAAAEVIDEQGNGDGGVSSRGEPDPTLGDPQTQETVEFVEVGRYIGLWYEISGIPQGFQASCTGTTATYAVVDETTISVLNRCNLGDLNGREVAIEGEARIVDTRTNSKLEVDFGFGGSPYWIVDLGSSRDGEPYPWAAVSNQERSMLWILSREKTMPPMRFEAIFDRLNERGFSPERMEMTKQIGSEEGATFGQDSGVEDTKPPRSGESSSTNYMPTGGDILTCRYEVTISDPPAKACIDYRVGEGWNDEGVRSDCAGQFLSANQALGSPSCAAEDYVGRCVATTESGKLYFAYGVMKEICEGILAGTFEERPEQGWPTY